MRRGLPFSAKIPNEETLAPSVGYVPTRDWSNTTALKIANEDMQNA